MNYKGVIFDLDGTLVNSLTDLAKYQNENDPSGVIRN